MRAARDALDPRVLRALDQAIEHVRRFTEPQRPQSTRTRIAPGIDVERRWAPLAGVGCYVPGGSAPYPSSLVMTVVPAQVAGVERVVVASPADRAGANHRSSSGLPACSRSMCSWSPVARRRSGHWPTACRTPASHPWTESSARATHGSPPRRSRSAARSASTCPRAHPRAWSSPRCADPDHVAADLITQAEHGPDSPAISVTTDAAFDAIEERVCARLATASRRDILEAALAAHGRIALAPDLDAAIDFVNEYGPEHLSVDVDTRTDRRATAQRRLAVRRAVGARICRRLRNGRESRAPDRRTGTPSGRSGRRGAASSSRSSVLTAKGSPPSATRSRRWPRPRGSSPTGMRSSPASTAEPEP